MGSALKRSISTASSSPSNDCTGVPNTRALAWGWRFAAKLPSVTEEGLPPEVRQRKARRLLLRYQPNNGYQLKAGHFPCFSRNDTYPLGAEQGKFKEAKTSDWKVQSRCSSATAQAPVPTSPLEIFTAQIGDTSFCRDRKATWHRNRKPGHLTQVGALTTQ